MSFKDYSLTPADNTALGDGTYIGPNMLRNKVRPALQQIAADGKELSDAVLPAGDRAGKFLAWDASGNASAASGVGGADAALRTDLAAAGGSDLVKYGNGTVADALNNTTARNLDPIVIDLHWEIMKGRGWLAMDPGDGSTQFNTTFTSAAAANATSLAVTDGSFFKTGQLVAYQGTDTYWYTTVVASVAGTTLTLAEGLPAAVSVGGLIGQFFNDHNHPRQYGSYAIADRLIARLLTAPKRELIDAQRDWTAWQPVAGGTTVVYPTLDYTTPGSNGTGLQAAKVTTTATNDGVCTAPQMLPAGQYEIEIPVNPLNDDGARHTVEIFAEDAFFGTGSNIPSGASVQISGLNSVQLVRLRINKADASVLNVTVRSKAATAATFAVGVPRFYRVVADPVDLTAGTWVAIGDSWFANPWILDRIETRLPNVDLTRKGTTGNTIADILARFDADVTPYAPRVVLTDAGSTNDWAAGTNRNVFESQVRELQRKCAAIGAQLIILSPTVGDINDTTQLANSREYAAAVDFEARGPGDRQTRFASQYFGTTGQPITLAAGEKRRLLISPFAMSRGATADRMGWAVSNSGLQIRVGYSTILTPPGGSLENEQAYSSTGLELKNIYYPRTLDTNTRYLMVVAVNTTGADQTITHFDAAFRAPDLLA